MKNFEIRNKVNELFSRIDQLNRKSGFKRFYGFSADRGDRLFEYGAYDYHTKKYVLYFAQSFNSEADLKELEKFLSIKR